MQVFALLTCAVVSTWPPAGADARYVWREGASSGPLGRRVDRLFEGTFRGALAKEAGVGRDELGGGYDGVIALSRLLSGRESSGEGARSASRRVLRALFPNWPPGAPAGRVGLLHWFGVLFARPFPGFSAKLNAWVTWWAAQWLMGPCSLQRLDAAELARAPRGPGGLVAISGDGEGQQLLVHRCRYLEVSGCASICVDCCKMPTQDFFNHDMGVPMRMLPDYDTLQCRFQFGVAPTDDDEAEARAVPCLGGCPSAAAMREARGRGRILEGDCVRMM
jgi:hypothetical protein